MTRYLIAGMGAALLVLAGAVKWLLDEKQAVEARAQRAESAYQATLGAFQEYAADVARQNEILETVSDTRQAARETARKQQEVVQTHDLERIARRHPRLFARRATAASNGMLDAFELLSRPDPR